VDLFYTVELKNKYHLTKT